jgi:ribonuclease PH
VGTKKISSSKFLRADGRHVDALRSIHFEAGAAPQAAGSVLCAFGNTRVICAASIDEGVPRWMKEQNVTGGWLTAEYSMLPYSTVPRKPRDITKGRLDGRSQEIQRLIGRSLRAVVDLEGLGPRTLAVDCDVLAADGGTRTAAITGAFLAVALACHKLKKDGLLTGNPLRDSVAAVSVGLCEGRALTDLCYTEDVSAAVDMNVVATGGGRLVEVQGSGEEATFSRRDMDRLLTLALGGIQELAQLQQSFLKRLRIPWPVTRSHA